MINWQESQIQALMTAGVDAVDAQAAVNFVATLIEQTGLNAATDLPSAMDLQEHVWDLVQDARIAWYADVPVWAKRSLDAGEE